jgi:hypothetical protein
MRPAEDELRRRAILELQAMLREPVEVDGDDRWHTFYIAARLLPILEREEAASKGRGDRAELAGEIVQLLCDGGMLQKEARKLVQKRTGLKYTSVGAAHRRFLKTGQPSRLYQEWLEHLEAFGAAAGHRPKG